MTRGRIIRADDLFCHRNSCLSATLWPPQGTAAADPAAGGPPPGPAVATPAVPAGDAAGDEGLGERDRLVQAMERSGWVQAKAARLLGLTPRQIGYALKKHGIELRRL